MDNLKAAKRMLETEKDWQGAIRACAYALIVIADRMEPEDMTDLRSENRLLLDELKRVRSKLAGLE